MSADRLLWCPAVGLLVPLSLLASGLATAAPNPWLETAKSSYARLDCERVLSDLELAAKVPTNDAATQLAIFDYRGRCQIALGQRPEADETFAKMLALDPQAELEAGLSPKILDAFKAVKLRLYPADYLALRELPGSEGLHRAQLVDPWRRAGRVVLGRWNPLTRQFDEEPLPPTAGIYQLQAATGAAWFIEARAASGEALALLGRKDSPARAAPVAAMAPASAPATATARPETSGSRQAARWASVGGGAALTVAAFVLWGVSATSRSSADNAKWADEAVTIGHRSAGENAAAWSLFLGGAVAVSAGMAFTW